MFRCMHLVCARQVPIGAEDRLDGVVDLVDMKAPAHHPLSSHARVSMAEFEFYVRV